ncbi:MAG: sigma-54-dependent Fis family transcriptional regulator [Bacteroidia bacterium]|nr:sigma-54-dependent Fis family transcriptional regulator [Bacteroidia bacterium]
MKVFVVEDDPWFREFITYTLSLNASFEVTSFETGKEVLNAMNQKPDAITLDFRLPDTDGAVLLKKIKDPSPQTEAVIISEQDKIDTAVELLKNGAYDYLVKSKDMRERLLSTFNRLQTKLTLHQRIEYLENEVKKKYDFRKTLIGSSEPFTAVFNLIDKAANTNIHVMITGETGTGKEEVAKAIHHNSKFSKGKFVAVNMGAIPSELAESELFGHEKGAFTGALTQRAGKFEEAHGGTLFLDEIAEMPLTLQVKLLRALQEREVVRIGSNNPVKFNCRIITATHRDLTEEVKKGVFRDDLYYRLLGLQIKLPPLRERGNDVLLLAHHFIKLFCNENKLPVKSINCEAQKKLLTYPFPGNIRELKSVIELAAVMSSGEITTADITFGNSNLLNRLLLEEMTLEEYNTQIIRHYLKKYDNNVVLTAQKLGIGKSTIYRLLKEEKI